MGKSWKDSLNFKKKEDVVDDIGKHIDNIETNKKDKKDKREWLNLITKPPKTDKKIKRTPYVDLTNIVIGIIFACFFYLLIMYQFTKGVRDQEEIFFIISVLVGMFAWLPFGIPIGAVIMNPYLRCRVLRLLSPRKNYGIVHIVSKGKYIVTMIKDLNNSIIMKKDALWGISKGYIYNINNKNLGHKILSENIHYISNVPTIYLDYESMKPLDFYKEETKISPEQLGSSLVGWSMVQKKKSIRVQKQVNIWYIVLASLIGINMAMTYYIFMLLTQGSG